MKKIKILCLAFGLALFMSVVPTKSASADPGLAIPVCLPIYPDICAYTPVVCSGCEATIWFGEWVWITIIY